MADINKESLNSIINICKDNREMMDFIWEAIESFEAYHRSIYTMEMRLVTIKSDNIERIDYQDLVTSLDKFRSECHNTVILNVNILNRIAGREKQTPVYAGIVSEDKPYRRELANAVLAYVESVIQNRS